MGRSNYNRRGIIHIGDKEVYERTNPDYVDERAAKLASDYQKCPKEWRNTFIAGLDSKDWNALKEILERKP